jgi:hypothetical protein
MVQMYNAHSILADLSATVGSGLKNTDLLEGLNDSSLNTGGRVSVVGGSDSSSVLGSVKLGKGSNTHGLSEVDVSGNGGWIVSANPNVSQAVAAGMSKQCDRNRAEYVQFSKSLPSVLVTMLRCSDTRGHLLPIPTHQLGRRTSRGRKERAPSANRS